MKYRIVLERKKYWPEYLSRSVFGSTRWKRFYEPYVVSPMDIVEFPIGFSTKKEAASFIQEEIDKHRPPVVVETYSR